MEQKINKLPSSPHPRCCFPKRRFTWPSEPLHQHAEREILHVGLGIPAPPRKPDCYILILTLQDHACKRKQQFETKLCRDLERMILVKESLMSVTLKYAWKCLWFSAYSKITEDYEIHGASCILILGNYLVTLVSNVPPAISPATPNTRAWAPQEPHLPWGSASFCLAFYFAILHMNAAVVYPLTTPCPFVFLPTHRWQDLLACVFPVTCLSSMKGSFPGPLSHCKQQEGFSCLLCQLLSFHLTQKSKIHTPHT